MIKNHFHIVLLLLFSCYIYMNNVVVQSLSRVRLFATPWTAAPQASLSFTISWGLLRLTSIELVMPSNHLLLCHPLLLLPSIFCSIRVFSNESALRVRSPMYWNFSFSISPSNEYSGLISFRVDWFDLLQSKGLSRVFPSTIQKHQFFSAQPSLWSNSNTYMTTGKIIALTIWTFISKVMSLLFNMLSRFAIAFHSSSKHLLISWLQSLSTVVLEPKKKTCHCFHFFSFYLPWIDGIECHDLSFFHVEF